MKGTLHRQIGASDLEAARLGNEVIVQWGDHGGTNVGGLRGTGSHDYGVKDLFASEARTTQLEAAPWASGALYRTPLQALLDTSMAAVALGIGRAAIEALYELAQIKHTSAASTTPVAERPMLQANGAKAEALLRSARSLFYQTAGGYLGRRAGGPAAGRTATGDHAARPSTSGESNEM